MRPCMGRLCEGSWLEFARQGEMNRRNLVMHVGGVDRGVHAVDEVGALNS